MAPAAATPPRPSRAGLALAASLGFVGMTRPRKTGRPRLEGPPRTIEAKKPWLKLEMSRRTWYRRQAEQRKGRE